MRTEVFCRTRFTALHHWPEAPPEVEFLRTLHRHEFHVEVHIVVSHDDRDVEFILFKQQVDNVIATARYGLNTNRWSCEQWASHILSQTGASKVMVSEDGENGAWVYA